MQSKKKLQIKNIIFLIVIIVIGCYGCTKINNKPDDKTSSPEDSQTKVFKELGYSDEEIKIVFNKLDKDKLVILKNKKYNKNLVNLIKEKYFIYNKLDSYYKMCDKYPNLDAKEVVTRVNVNVINPFYTDYKDISNKNNSLVLVNKYNKLSSSFIPKDVEKIDSRFTRKNVFLSTDARKHFEKMCDTISKEGLTLIGFSGYRTYESQENIYNYYLSIDSKDKVDTYSARPGFSEHQTGLAIDVAKPTSDYNHFDTTDEYSWLKDNAHKFGFILRYPKGLDYLTGYMYEPWHYRYVGEEVATYIYENNITFDEYYAYFLEK
ncbi:MAG: M15 family metallopeptidase [Bacilli bacterium]